MASSSEQSSWKVCCLEPCHDTAAAFSWRSWQALTGRCLSQKHNFYFSKAISAPKVEMGILPLHPQGLQKHSRKSDLLTRLWICKFGRNSIDHKDLSSPPGWKRVGIGGMSCWATGGSLPPAAGWCCAAVALPTTQREHTNFYHN